MVTKKNILNLVVILTLTLGFLPAQSLAAPKAPNAYPCPCTIWTSSNVPQIPAQNEALPVELGVNFQSEANGYITGLRFYKGTGNSGMHYGHLWTTDGTLLGTATFANETDTGWQVAAFPTPITVVAGTTYIASYHTPTGHWSLTPNGLLAQVYNQPLTALATVNATPGNGVYKYGPSGSFPNETVGGSNYWVDVVFNTTVPDDNTAPTVSAVTPVNLATDVDKNTNVTALFNEAMFADSINTTNIELRGPSDTLVPAVVTYVNGSYTATLDPTSALADSTIYTARIKGGSSGVTDLAGNPLAGDYSWSFTTAAPDLIAPTVSAVTPLNLATGENKNVNVTARFSEAMAADFINTTNFELRDPSSILVQASVTYVNGTYTATLDPTSALANSSTYTARIKGGSSGVTDLAGNPLAADYSWSFTTAASPDEGPGGPILVIADTGNPFGRFYAEILRTEGLNEFAVMNISLVSSGILANYDVVLLGEMNQPLSTGQVTMFTDWVTLGGNLIAMRPDKQLAGLLGLTDASGVLPAPGQLNAYLLVDTSQDPGKGIVNQTIQYHGIADLYTLNGATAVATLYSNATTATTNPAVTVRSVGTSGGQAAVFTYDLARSVVYTRQGNPAWAGQNRDPNDPLVSRIISHDLYFGNASWDPQPDYVDFNKLTIPQADEQQRLLANLIQFMNRDKKPLPHFWYFPRGEKAVVIMTGDDHGGGTGTIGRFDHYKAISTPGCSLDNWECIRSSSFMFISGAMSDFQAAGYNTDGFEIGLHVNTNCVDWTPSSLASFYQNQLTAWYASYPSLPDQLSERTHCVNWTDWVTQAKVEASHGIRMDTNYYYYPPNWVLERPGMYTGSGMPMRFADLDGTMIDVYQAVTQMTDESSLQGYGYFNPLQINTLLDNAVGAPGFYGAFLANMHTDGNPHAGSETIINAAVPRGVPVVSGRQMVTWLDGRNASSFGAISWNDGTLSFSITTGTGSNGIQAMLPTSTKAGFLTDGFLTGITRGGAPVPFTKQTIKGIEYAFFNAVAGSYMVTYAPDTTPPVITNVVAIPATGVTTGTARITWTTDELSNSQVDYGITLALGTTVSNATLVTSHEINLTGLTLGQAYYFRVTSTDSSANSATYPATGNTPLTFTVPDARIIDTTVADFSGGSLVPNTYITSDEDGEVILSPATGSEFFGSDLPAGWFIAQYPATGSGGTATVSGGLLTMDGTRVGTNATFSPGRSLDFVATFTAGPFQHVGFGVDFFNTPWAIFSTEASGTILQARSNNAATPTPTIIDTTIPGNWFGVPHHYRIEWNASNIIYYIDGAQVASHTIAIATEMRPLAAEYTHGAQILTVDWLRMSPYLTPGTFTSRVWDAVGTADWGAPEWVVDLPAGTSLEMSVRTGDTPVPNGSWSSYTPMTYGEPIGRSSRYLQYQAVLVSPDITKTPILRQVAFGYVHHPDVIPPTIVGQSPAPGAIDVAQNTNIDITFSEAMNSGTINGTTIRLRKIGTAEDVPAVVSYSGRTATLNPTPILNLGALYQVTVAGSVTDLTGNSLGSDVSWTFTTVNAGSFTDNTSADFSAGIPGSGTYVAETTDGEVMLAPIVGAEFSGSTLPAGWNTADYKPQGDPDPATATVSGGQLTLDSARLYQSTFFGPGRWLEFVATFNTGNYQHFGFGDTYSSGSFAIFSTITGSSFYARSSGVQDTLLASYFGTPHRYRIEWNTNSVVYYIDGAQVASHAAIITSMRPMPAAYGGPAGRPMTVNWLRMGPYSTTGTFISRIFDVNDTAAWTSLTATINRPADTTATIETRTSNDGSSWSDWAAVNPDNSLQSPSGRYFQYRVILTTSNVGVSPVVENVTINYSINPRAILPLQASWNLISLPLQPVSPYDAETWLLAINEQGNHCTEIDQWDAGGWVPHLLYMPFPFPIAMGKGYFVRCDHQIPWIQQGIRLSSGVTISLSPGYNLISIPHPETGLDAQGVLAAIISQEGSCSEIHHWLNGGWESYYLGLPPEFGNFNILPYEGYFVRCSVNSSFTP